MHALIAQSFLDSLSEMIDGAGSALEALWGPLCWALLWLLPVTGLCCAMYFLLSLPMRRRERARIFLDLIETGLRRGTGPEQTIVASAGSQDPALGVRFHILAEHLRSGLRLEQALGKVPRLLPPGIAATLKTGLEIGDLARVLPACRKQLRDCVSQTRSALNFLFVMLFMVLPLFPVLVMILLVYVLPRFREIYNDMMPGVPLPAYWAWDLMLRLVYLQICLTAGLQVLTFFYIAGPRAKGWLGDRFRGLTDRFAWRLPWRRKRLQRDFCGMLATLLDAGLPEPKAVQLAAASTASGVLTERAGKACAALAGGTSLAEAVQCLDESGELRWRLGNAARAGQGFLAALSGWIEALDARAFQQEQAAAQVLTSALVVFNGLLVGLVAVNVFLVLTTMIREGTLW
jgi:type II secretory pathway component PulF